MLCKMNERTSWFLVLLTSWLCFSCVVCNRENEVYLELIQKNENVFNFFNPELSRSKQLINRVLHDENRGLDKDCEDSLLSIYDGLEKKEAWALRYLESNGRARNGFLAGYPHDLGDFNGCISIEPKKTASGKPFSGQFCLISIQTPFTEAMREQPLYRMVQPTLSNSSREMIDFAFGGVQGLCIPSTCKVKQLLLPVNKVLAEFELKAIAQSSPCSSGINFLDFLDLKFFISSVILLIPAGLSVLTLVYENDLLKPFSLKDNFHNIYLKAEKSEEAFIHGFRCIYLWCSIPSHLLGFFYVVGFAPFVTSGAKSMDWLIVKPFVDRLLLGIDFMFFVSGVKIFLTLYEPMKRKKSNIFKTLVRWPVMVYPSYVAYICVFTILSYFADPYGDLMNNFLGNCWRVGWKLLTFTSNNDHTLDFCIATSWFNSVNLQISFVHYAILFVILKNEALGLLASMVLLCSNLLYEAYRMYAEHLPPIMEISTGDSLEFFNLEREYLSFSSHLSPVTVGFLCGWIYKTKTLTLLKNPIIARYLPPITFVISLNAILFPEALNWGLIPRCEILLVSYFVLKRIVLVLFPATMLFLFKAGQLKSAKAWLSISPLVAVSRIAPTIILCQFIYFLFSLSTAAEVVRFGFINLAKETLFALTTIFVLANLFYFLCEAPMTNLLKKYTLDKMVTRTPVSMEINNNELAVRMKTRFEDANTSSD